MNNDDIHAKSMLLKRRRFVKITSNTRSFADERVKCDRHIYEYRDDNGNEYRKAFETVRGGAPNAPETGTQDELNALCIQYRQGLK
jgi:hypothetical protein